MFIPYRVKVQYNLTCQVEDHPGKHQISAFGLKIRLGISQSDGNCQHSNRTDLESTEYI